MTDPLKRRPGRPRILGTGDKRRTVTFDPETLAQARKLGAGNINAGVRKALQISADLETKALEHPGFAGPDAGESTIL